MKLRDCVIKVSGPEYWLHHLTSSYKVRLNEEALEALESLLSHPTAEGLAEQEAFIFERLSRKGLIEEGKTPDGEPALRILGASSLQVLDLELTSRCNLQCRHCFAALDARSAMGRPVLDAMFAGVAALEPVSIVLNGGEPLLNPLWRELVSEARQRHVRVVIMTNGTLVTEDAAGFLASQRVAKVIISLDGFKETHEALRGSNTFERTVTGIRRLAGVGVPTFVTTMVSPELLAERTAFEQFCLRDLGASGIRYSAVMPIGKGTSAPDRFQVERAVLRELHRTGQIQEDHDATSSRYADRAWPCGAGVEQCFISADGRVYQCHYFQNLEEAMGDLSVSSLAEIYHASLVGPVAARQHWSELPECRDCPALEACHGGCRARAKLLGGHFSAPDPYCCTIHR